MRFTILALVGSLALVGCSSSDTGAVADADTRAASADATAPTDVYGADADAGPALDAEISPAPPAGWPQTACVPVIDHVGGTAPYGRGRAFDVHFAHGAAWVGTTVGVEKVDYSDPSAPVGVAWIDLPGNVTALAATDRAVLAATSSATLHVIAPEDATLTRTIALPGPVGDIEIAGALVWITAGNALVAVDPTADTPNQQIVAVLPFANRCTGLAVAGDLAVVSVSLEGLATVDITTPSAPSRLATAPLLQRDFGDVVIHGGIAWVAAAYEGLHGFDVSSPAEPTFVLLAEPQWGWLPEELVLVGDLLIAGDSYPNPDVRFLDLSNPREPSFIGSLASPTDALGLAVDGDLLAVASDGAGLGLADISDPREATWLGRLDGDGNSTSVAIWGDALVVADGLGGVRIVDATTHTVRRTLATEQSPAAVAVAGDYAYVASNIREASWTPHMQLTVHALQPPDAQPDRQPDVDPIWSADFVGSVRDLAVIGQTLVLATSHGNLKAFDISVPTEPTPPDDPSEAPSAAWFETSGDMLLTIERVSSIEVIRTLEEGDTPGTLRVLDSLTLDSFASRIAFVGDVAIAADLLGDVLVIDVSDPAAMRLAGRVATQERLQRVVLFEDVALVANDKLATFAIDVTHPERPLAIGRIPSVGRMLDAVSAGQAGAWWTADGPQLVSRYDVACAGLDEGVAVGAPPATTASVRLVDLLHGPDAVDLTVDQTTLSAGFARVSTPVQLPEGDHAATLADTASTLSAHTAQVLAVAWGSNEAPRLLAVPHAPSPDHAGASVRFVNAAAGTARVDALLAVGGQHLGLGALSPGAFGDAIGVPGGFEATLSVATADLSFVVATPPITPGSSITAVLATTPDALPFVAWIADGRLLATLSPDLGTTDIRVLHLAANQPAVRLRVDGQLLFDGAALRPLDGSVRTTVPLGAVDLLLEDAETGASLGHFDLFVGWPGQHHTIALLDDDAGALTVTAYEDISTAQTSGDTTELWIMNAAWPEAVDVDLIRADGETVAAQWDSAPYGALHDRTVGLPAASYGVRVSTPNGVWNFALGYFPDYGNVITLGRDAKGRPIATVQSGASEGLAWRLADEHLAQVRLVNLSDAPIVPTLEAADPDVEPWASPTEANSSSGWQKTRAGAYTLNLGDDLIALDLAAQTVTTAVYVGPGVVHVLDEPAGNQARVRLVNTSDAPLDAAWSGKTIASDLAAGGVSADVSVDSRVGALKIDRDQDGIVDLTFTIDGAGVDPVMGLYFLDGDVPRVLVHRSSTYITEAYAAEATSWFRIIYVPSAHSDIAVTAPEIGLEPFAINTHQANASQLPFGTWGPSVVKPGATTVLVGSANVPVDFVAGESRTLLIYGDPTAPDILVVEPSDSPRIFQANPAFPAVSVAAEDKDTITPLVTGLAPGQWADLTDLPDGTDALRLDADSDGQAEWQMWGPYLDPATVVVYGDPERAALLHFGDGQGAFGNVGHVGSWLP